VAKQRHIAGFSSTDSAHREGSIHVSRKQSPRLQHFSQLWLDKLTNRAVAGRCGVRSGGDGGGGGSLATSSNSLRGGSITDGKRVERVDPGGAFHGTARRQRLAAPRQCPAATASAKEDVGGKDRSPDEDD